MFKEFTQLSQNKGWNDDNMNSMYFNFIEEKNLAKEYN